MKKFYRNLCLALSICLLLITGMQPIYASEKTGQDASADMAGKEAVLEQTMDCAASELIINPLYEGVLDQKEVAAEVALIRQTVPYSEVIFQTEAAAVEYLRSQMVKRVNNIVVSLDYSIYTDDSIRKIFYDALEHWEDCSGQEGDALRWGWSGCEITASSAYNAININYTIAYYTTFEQEESLTAAVDAAMAELSLEGEEEYDKVKAIHDYICNHVDYDYTYQKYSAYSALCEGTAVCQGYALLFYRMCKEADLSVRVITGTGNGENHGWNIVRVGSYYYNVDCTWDGQDSNLYDSYFLKNDEDFLGHVRADEYNSAEFHEAYPMAKESWIDYSAFEEPYQLDNAAYAYTTVDGKTVTSTAEGKPKVLLFFRTDCMNSMGIINSICNRNLSGVDIIAAEINNASKEEVIEFKNAYGNDTITFAYDTGENINNSMWEYVRKAWGSDAVHTPVIVYIDTNNKFQFATEGYSSLGELTANIAYYLTDNDGEGGGNEEEDNPGESSEVKNPEEAYTGLKEEDGRFVYYVDGKRDTTTTGLILFDGSWFFVKEGVMDSTQNGFVEYDGERFYVAEGRLLSNANGIVMDGTEWYFVAQGRMVKEFTGLAEYDHHWFVLENGKLDTAYNNLYDYNGGIFLVAAGQIKYEYSGLYQAPDRKWYFIAEGQVSNGYTGLAYYDNHWFYIIAGVLAENYTGWVTYDGGRFYVVNGMVQP